MEAARSMNTLSDASTSRARRWSIFPPLALAAVLILPACAVAPVSAPAPEAAPVQQASPQTVASAASAAAANDDEDPATAAAAPIDPVRPEARIDIDDRGARLDLWQRIRDGFAIRDIDDRHVKQRERYFAGQPEYVNRMTDRGSRYLFHVVEEVQRRNLPTELALLPFIESAFNPEAVSSARASGMWQFMPATGRHFDLKQNVFRDDRRDVLASTQSGARLPDAPARHVRRLASCAGGLQLGRRQCAARDPRQSQGRPADRLRQPEDALRDARLCAQAAGCEEHRAASARLSR